MHELHIKDTDIHYMLPIVYTVLPFRVLIKYQLAVSQSDFSPAAYYR